MTLQVVQVASGDGAAHNPPGASERVHGAGSSGILGRYSAAACRLPHLLPLPHTHLVLSRLGHAQHCAGEKMDKM